MLKHGCSDAAQFATISKISQEPLLRMLHIPQTFGGSDSDLHFIHWHLDHCCAVWSWNTDFSKTRQIHIILIWAAACGCVENSRKSKDRFFLLQQMGLWAPFGMDLVELNSGFVMVQKSSDLVENWAVKHGFTAENREKWPSLALWISWELCCISHLGDREGNVGINHIYKSYTESEAQKCLWKLETRLLWGGQFGRAHLAQGVGVP